MDKNKNKDSLLYRFATESDNIENIHDPGRHTTHEKALETFLNKELLTMEDIEKFVRTIEPRAFLRTKPEHRVWIGGGEAPPASVSLTGLSRLLEKANSDLTTADLITAYEAHLTYETLHPFIDGNGRSGRALWLWMMQKQACYDLKYGFLRMWYYQTLARHKQT